MKIEDNFLPPCAKCLGSHFDNGQLCKLHYALVFLHYHATIQEWHPQRDCSVLTEMFQTEAMMGAYPVAKQVLTTADIFYRVKRTWRYGAEPGKLYYEV